MAVLRMPIDTLARLDLDPIILRKSAPVYQLENTREEIGSAKMVALVVSTAEFDIVGMNRTKGRRGNTSIR